MRVLGIDPGSVVTGFGVVAHTRGVSVHVAHGTLRAPRGAALPERLAFLHEAVAEVAARHEPDCAVVEQVFVASSARSALVLGQARGVILAALCRAGLSVHELSAREVKKSVVGTGAASKAQVQEMVVRLLDLDVKPAADAADALAAALCFAHARRLLDAGVRGSTRARQRRGGRRATSLAAWRRP